MSSNASHWHFPKIVAHRGAGTLAPENTLAAMAHGVKLGFHAVEFDVMLAADGVPVLMHDPKLGRTIAGSGTISELDSRTLQGMDAGSWMGPQFAGEPVPLFSRVIEFCCTNGVWMNVEIKPAPGFEVATGQAAAATLQAYMKSAVLCSNTRVATPLFSSFSFDALMAAKQTAPEIPRGFLLDRLTDGWLEKVRQLGAVAVHTNHKHMTPALVQEVKAAGLGLFCYTVNDPARAHEILGWGVDAFCTDRLDLIPADFS